MLKIINFLLLQFQQDGTGQTLPTRGVISCICLTKKLGECETIIDSNSKQAKLKVLPDGKLGK